MGLLKDFLRIDADRRAAHQSLRQDVQRRRIQIEELSVEARRKRDEVGMLEDGLRRLAEDIARAEEEVLELEAKREEHDHEALERKIEAVRANLEADREAGGRVADEFRSLRSEFESERERLLSQADTGRMMDNFFQIETFLKDTAKPIPDAARRALAKERADLMARIGPLVAPPPTTARVFKGTIVYTVVEEDEPKALVAFGLPEELDSSAHDLASLLLYGAYAQVVERVGPGAPRPRQDDGVVTFEQTAGLRSPDEVALELFLAVEEGLKKATASVSVPCELSGVFVEPEIAAALFAAPREARRF